MQDKYIVNEADLERYAELLEQGCEVGSEVEWGALIVRNEPWPRDIGQEVLGISFKEGN